MLLGGHETTANWLTFCSARPGGAPGGRGALARGVDDVTRLRACRGRATSSACPTCEPCWRRRCACTRRPGASGGARSNGARWAASTCRSAPSSGSRSSPSTGTRASGRSRSASTRSAGSTRPPSAPPARGVLPLRRRSAALHRRALRPGRGRHRHGDAGAALVARPRLARAGGAGGEGHAASARRPAHARRGPLRRAPRSPSPRPSGTIARVPRIDSSLLHDDAYFADPFPLWERLRHERAAATTTPSTTAGC